MMNRTKTPQNAGKFWFALFAFTIISFFTLTEKANAQKFRNLETGVADSVLATCTDGNDYYVSYIENPRKTYRIGPDTLRIAKWDGTKWTKFPRVLIQYLNNINLGGKSIQSMQVYNGEIIVPVLDYNNDTSNKVHSISYLFRYNGQKWDTLNILQGHVKDIEIFNNKLFFALNYIWQDSSCLLSWDGKQFSQIGVAKYTDGGSASSIIHTLLATPDYLYAGGNFTEIDSLKANRIARWNGKTWDTISNNHNFKYVFGIAYFENELYLNGNDINYGIEDYSELKYLQNNTWKTALKTIRSISFIESMQTYKDKLYISERLQYRNGYGVLPYNFIHKWDGNTWTTDSSIIDVKSELTYFYRINDPNTRLDATENALYLSGKFKTIGKDNFNFVAGIFEDSTSTSITGFNSNVKSDLVLYPNPATSIFNIENTSTERQNLRLINMMGQIVNVIQVNAGEKAIFDASQLPKGLYFIKSTDNENSAAMKVLVQH